MAKFSLTIVLLLLLYPFSLNFLPVLSSRTVFGAIGATLLLTKLYQKLLNRVLFISNQTALILVTLFFISFVASISVGINNTNDLEFVSYSVSMIVGICGAYFYYRIVKKLKVQTDEFAILSLIVYTVALQSIISLLMFLIPRFNDLIFSIIYLDELKAMKVTNLEGTRIIGFGRSFFGSGIYSGMGLILISYLVRYYKLNKQYLLFFALLYILIFSIGMLMARTTVVGFLMSLLMLFSPNIFTRHLLLSNITKKTKFILYTLLTPILLSLFIYLFIPDIFSKIKPILDWAFELFINFFTSGTLETRSSNATLEMLFFPDNLKTWLIGDGLWTVPGSYSYYMHTDVGYSRLIFYFGLAGLIIFFIYQFIFISFSFSQKIVVSLIFLYFAILNIKGFTDLSNFLLLIFTFSQLEKQRASQVKENKSIT